MIDLRLRQALRREASAPLVAITVTFFLLAVHFVLALLVMP